MEWLHNNQSQYEASKQPEIWKVLICKKTILEAEK